MRTIKINGEAPNMSDLANILRYIAYRIDEGYISGMVYDGTTWYIDGVDEGYDEEEDECMCSWWSAADFLTMERVTGYRQNDFSPEDGYQDFIEACDDWWEAKSYDEKRAIFKEHNSDE